MPNNQTINGDHQTIRGNNNVINGDHNTITGNNNRIKGDFNRISGDDNVINGDYNNISGANNRISGDFNTENGNSGSSKKNRNINSVISSGINNCILSGSSVGIVQSSNGSYVGGRKLKPGRGNNISMNGNDITIDGVRITPQNEHLYFDDVQSNSRTINQGNQTITQTFRNQARTVDPDGDLVQGTNYVYPTNTRNVTSDVYTRDTTTRRDDDCGSRSTSNNDDLTEEEKKIIKMSELEIRLNKILKEVDDDNEASKKLQCSVCMAYEKNVLFQCGHKYCSKCAFQLYHEKKDCPSCREKITTVIQLINDE